MAFSQTTAAKKPLPAKGQPKEALRHLCGVDPVLGTAILRVGPIQMAERPADLFALCSAILGQMISVKAARRVVERLSERIGDRATLTPEAILSWPPEELRAAVGVTRTKAVALQGLAELWQREKLDEKRLRRLPDEEMIQLFTQVRGVGPWTVKMFLMFNLRRPDVMPFEDLGIREAMLRLYTLPERPTPREVLRIAEPWRPWRTVACWYLWQSLLLEQGNSLESPEGGWW